MTPATTLEAELPLSEATAFILISLAPGPRHGYAILKDVEALSGGRLRLSTGTLYGAIKRLLDDGWIEPAAGGEGDAAGRPRKAYRLTALGRRVLKAETARIQALVKAAKRCLAGGAR